MNDLLSVALRLIIEAIGDDQNLQSKIPSLVKLLRDGEQCVSHDHCVICRNAEIDQTSRIIEQHHIAGRAGLSCSTTVCRNCHEYLRDHQRAWLLCRRDKRSKLSSFFFGWADVFDLLAKRSGQLFYENLAEKFRAQGWHIRNNPQRKMRTPLKVAVTV